LRYRKAVMMRPEIVPSSHRDGEIPPPVGQPTRRAFQPFVAGTTLMTAGALLASVRPDTLRSHFSHSDQCHRRPVRGAEGAMQALTFRELTKTYKNGVQALKGIDLTVEEGDFFALLGPNGAGKTTAIGIVTSLVNKTSGKVQVFGHDIDTELAVAKSCIGLVPQEINFNQFETVTTILLNQAGFYGIPRHVASQRLEKYLTALQLWEKRNAVSRTLSGGMKRRLMIARALMHEPRLLILDEPTAGVDIEVRRSMWTFMRDINAAGTTIILTTHYLEEAENLCRHVAIIDKGRIIENDRMSRVLRKLQTEVFVFNLRNPITAPPVLPGYTVSMPDDHSLEIEVSKDQSLNDIFSRLSASGMEVLSMRNKTNRLEELFMRLVNQKETAHG
jgi:ABC-2 type transport system ATP-binding protein